VLRIGRGSELKRPRCVSEPFLEAPRAMRDHPKVGGSVVDHRRDHHQDDGEDDSDQGCEKTEPILKKIS
jgi:hypothetical protein